MASSSSARSPPLPRLTVLISGSGTNLQALLDAIAVQTVPATIVRVLSNRKDAYGLERARRAAIPTTYHNLLRYKKQHPPTGEGVQAAREAYDRDLAALILADRPELVVCLGFMHVLSPPFLEPLAEAGVGVINLHPALPGQFNGTHAIERAHAAWQRGEIDRTGVMIHEVIAEVDMGPPLLVREIPFVSGTDEDLGALETRVHEIEWKIVVDGVNLALERMQAARKS